jgi:hypothetical protein
MLKTVGNPATRYGDQTIIDGNLVIGTSGKGISFSAIPGGTSELLDDYEEGDWTPTISGSVTPGTGTYFNQTGRYTKIGRLVFIQAWINCGGGHTGTGNMLLTGLPFTSASGGASIFAGFSVGMFFNLSLSLTNVLTLNMTNGTATIDAMEYPVGGGSATALALDPTCAISFSGCYIVD